VNAPPSQLVSVVLAVRDGERFLAQAIASVLGQTLSELELIVVDDGSRDRTPQLLEEIGDSRLRVLRNEQPQGLAAALNGAIEQARGRFLARMDADDVALPRRLELQLARLTSEPELGIVGSGVAELDQEGRIGRVHPLPSGALVTRWRSLFGTPFFHPTVVLDRELLRRHGFRYDSAYDQGEAASEDYELWTRLLAVAEGDNVSEPLLFYRRHAGQASARQRDPQLELRRRIALGQIAAACPELDSEQAELAWLVGDGRRLPAGRSGEAADAFVAVLEAFSGRFRTRPEEMKAVEALAARALVRAAIKADRSERVRILRRAASLDPAFALRGLGSRAGRGRSSLALRRRARAWLAKTGRSLSDRDRPLRVAVVSPEPTPYRSPLFDRLAARPELDLTVIYSAGTVAGRGWAVEPRHRSVFLRGAKIPGLRRLLRHDYPLTPGIGAALRKARPEVVVVSGWSTFASQAAIVWCRAHRIPYLLLVSSHDAAPRPGWRRALKGAVVPRLVRSAAGALVLGTLSRRSLAAYGMPEERMHVFANTVDLAAWAKEAGRLAGRRPELRAALGAGSDDVLVLSVARLAPEKGLDTLIEAVAAAGDPRLALAVVGSGPEGRALERLAGRLGVRLQLVGDLPYERLPETYVAADLFALLSRSEPWGVVVNEAAVCGLPLILSDQVGAAPDLLREGENGALVPAGDVSAAAAALRSLATDSDLRLAAGTRSRELVQGWDYESSVESFLAAVETAARRRG
jgi:glycosyltransferase involved in cell wall biosynthesis